MEDRTHILVRRIGPPVAALAAVEAALYLLLDRSDTLHDLYASPALIALVVGVLGTVIRLRGRHGDARRHSTTRRQARRRDGGDAAANATPAVDSPEAERVASL